MATQIVFGGCDFETADANPDPTKAKFRQRSLLTPDEIITLQGGNTTVFARYIELAAALWRFWRRGGYVAEACFWLDEVLALEDENLDHAAVRARQRVLYSESKDQTILVVMEALQTRAKGE